MHFPSLKALAAKKGLRLCLAPTALSHFVLGSKGESGRLRRIYAFAGGLALDSNQERRPAVGVYGAWRQEQREAMDFYSAFAFQKEAPGAPTCREVAEGGRRVSASEQRQVWRPRSAGLCQRAPATWKQTV